MKYCLFFCPTVPLYTYRSETNTLNKTNNIILLLKLIILMKFNASTNILCFMLLLNTLEYGRIIDF